MMTFCSTDRGDSSVTDYSWLLKTVAVLCSAQPPVRIRVEPWKTFLNGHLDTSIGGYRWFYTVGPLLWLVVGLFLTFANLRALTLCLFSLPEDCPGLGYNSQGWICWGHLHGRLTCMTCMDALPKKSLTCWVEETNPQREIGMPPLCLFSIRLTTTSSTALWVLAVVVLFYGILGKRTLHSLT